MRHQSLMVRYNNIMECKNNKKKTLGDFSPSAYFPGNYQHLHSSIGYPLRHSVQSGYLVGKRVRLDSSFAQDSNSVGTSIGSNTNHLSPSAMPLPITAPPSCPISTIL